MEIKVEAGVNLRAGLQSNINIKNEVLFTVYKTRISSNSIWTATNHRTQYWMVAGKKDNIQLKIRCERETEIMSKYNWRKENITEKRLSLSEGDMMLKERVTTVRC